MSRISLWALCAIFVAVSLGSSYGGSTRETCNIQYCKLPECRCSDIRNPLTPFDPKNIPQIVYLTFDDAITITNYYELYEKIFTPARLNPNGARISGTFFVCHEYNNYTLTHQLYREGHEIALHSITHKADTEYWKNLDTAGWKAEFEDQIDQMETFGLIPRDEIIGYRVPFLQGGGDTMYGALKDSFQYESSRPTWTLRPVLFPYTAEFDSIQDCQIQPCPTGSYPGFWVMPLVDLMGSNNQPCAFADTCTVPTTKDAVKAWFRQNFNDHYNGRRAPFGIYTHATWLSQPETAYIQEAYLEFIDDILALGDVYIVSLKKGLDWQRNPAPVSGITNGTAGPDSWKEEPIKPNNCDFALTCSYSGPQVPPGVTERFMSVCDICPPNYPWLNNTLGTNPNQ